MTDSTATASPAPEPPEDPPAGRPPLVRNADGRLLAGVAAALGRHLGVDANIVRLALVVLTFVGGAGILAYLAGWVLIPADGQGGNGRGVLLRAAILAGVLVLSALLAGGAFVLAALGGSTGVAIAVILAGLAIAVAGTQRRARWLAVPALCLALPAGFAGAAGVDLRGGFGEREIRPAALADLQAQHKLGAGSLLIDLRAVDFDGRTQDLEIDLGIGELEIVVPPGVCVGGRAQVGMGEVRILDRSDAGVDLDTTYGTPGGPRAGRLLLDADVGMGEISVRSAPAGPFHVPGDEHHRVDQAGCAG